MIKDILERETGVEPATYTLAMCRSSQLNYSRVCQDPDLNWGPPVLQTDALPAELSWHIGSQNNIRNTPPIQLNTSLFFP